MRNSNNKSGYESIGDVDLGLLEGGSQQAQRRRHSSILEAVKNNGNDDNMINDKTAGQRILDLAIPGKKKSLHT